jgi:hypothetical protein
MKRRKSLSEMKKCVLAVGAFFVGLGCVEAWSQPQSAQASATAALTNDDVVRMVGAGLGDDTVIAKIRGSKTGFDTSAEALIDLKKAGLSDAVIRAMINPQASPAPGGLVGQEIEPGVYLEQDGQLVPIEPTIVSETKTANRWGAAFSYGISKVKLKAVVLGRQARTQARETKPVFHFYFGVSGAGLMFPVPSATSPNEFLLLRMDQKDSRREFQVGKAGVGSAAGGASTDDKVRVAFQSEKLGAGHYRVTLAAPLSPGEYCFFHPQGMGGPVGGAGGKVFDFSVRPGAAAGPGEKQARSSR